MDYGSESYILNVHDTAVQNQYFRRAVWTGEYMQMTIMSIPVCDDIGWEIHPDTDQYIRVEQGRGLVQFRTCEGQGMYERVINREEAVFVPAGTWHNVVNAGRCPLKLSSIYAPPHHKKGTVHRTKKDAE